MKNDGNHSELNIKEKC